MTETLDTPRFSGIGQFGPAYRYMLENDSHAAGSVDRVLAQRMIRLCPETVEYLYGAHTLLDIKYQSGSRPELEVYLGREGADKVRIGRFPFRIRTWLIPSGHNRLSLANNTSVSPELS